MWRIRRSVRGHDASGADRLPPIDLSSSRHYDLTNIKLVEWIFQMLHEKRFKSIVCEPVCTTFSPAQHPASRSYSQPLGFDRAEPKTFLGNTLAFRCLAAIKWFAWRCYALALLEQPQLSKMACRFGDSCCRLGLPRPSSTLVRSAASTDWVGAWALRA